MNKLIASLVLGLFLLTTAKADSIWTYQGNSVGDSLTDPNLCGCSLTGSITFDASLNPTAWSFTDGTHSLNQTDSTANINPFEGGVSTIPFKEWFVSITGNDGFRFWSQYYGSGFEATDLSGPIGMTDFLYVQGNKGSWIDGLVAAPEPGLLSITKSIILFVLGF